MTQGMLLSLGVGSGVGVLYKGTGDVRNVLVKGSSIKRFNGTFEPIRFTPSRIFEVIEFVSVFLVSLLKNK